MGAIECGAVAGCLGLLSFLIFNSQFVFVCGRGPVAGGLTCAMFKSVDSPPTSPIPRLWRRELCVCS